MRSPESGIGELAKSIYMSFGRYAKIWSNVALAYKNPYFICTTSCITLRALSRYWSLAGTFPSAPRFCDCMTPSVKSLSFWVQWGKTQDISETGITRTNRKSIFSRFKFGWPHQNLCMQNTRLVYSKYTTTCIWSTRPNEAFSKVFYERSYLLV